MLVGEQISLSVCAVYTRKKFSRIIRTLLTHTRFTVYTTYSDLERANFYSIGKAQKFIARAAAMVVYSEPRVLAHEARRRGFCYSSYVMKTERQGENAAANVTRD